MAHAHSDGSVTERLAEWICALRYVDIPERVLAKARRQIMSVVAAVHAGADTEAGRAVARAVASRASGSGRCTVLPSGEMASLHDAVSINSAYSMALDYDDYLYMGHTGHSAVLGSWAVCEAEGLSTKDFITAQVIANEIGGRVGASAVLGPQNGQAWSFIHAVEGAALAAKLLGLTERQVAHALAIALYQPTFTLWPGFMGPQSKVLTAAGPTLTGIEAANFAREGMTGARDIFEHPRKGFWASFTYTPLPHMLGGLGHSWVTDTLAYKKYPGCAYIDTTLDALFAALDAHRRAQGAPLRAADVEKIRVDANLLTVEMDNLSAEHIREDERLSPVNINFSIPFNTAIGIIAGKHTAAQLSQPFLDQHEATIRSLAARTELVHDWKMTFRVVQAFDAALGRGSVAAALTARDLVRVGIGFRAHLGGRRKHPLRLRALLSEHGGDLVRMVGKGLTARLRRPSRASARMGPADLSQADFTRFEMAFPARVVIETVAGARLEARQDVPFGAPGQREYFATAEEKFRTEVGAHLEESRVKAALQNIEAFEETPLAEVTRCVCARIRTPANAPSGVTPEGRTSS